MDPFQSCSAFINQYIIDAKGQDPLSKDTEFAIIRDFDAVRTELDTNGFAVVPGLIQTEECDDYAAQYKSWLKQFEPGFPDTA